MEDELKALKLACKELAEDEAKHSAMVERLKAAIRKHKRDKWGDYHVKDEGDETLYKQAED